MSPRKDTGRLIRIWSGIILILSLLILSTSSLYLHKPPGSHSPELPSNLILLVEYISMITSVMSLLALISSTIIDWRKEKRTQAKEALTRRLQEIRIEKESLELERERLKLRRQKSQEAK